MGTPRQRKAAEQLVANGCPTAEALREAGCSEAMARKPQKPTTSRSWLDLCDELGLTDGLIVTSIVEDIRAKPYTTYRSTRWKPPIHFVCACMCVAILKREVNPPKLTGVPAMPDCSDSPN